MNRLFFKIGLVLAYLLLSFLASAKTGKPEDSRFILSCEVYQEGINIL